MQLPAALPIDTWQRIGEQIAGLGNSSAWWLGDWLIHGECAYPNRYRQALAALRLDYQTLRNYAWVCRSVEAARRREKLSFQHHAEVAALPRAEQDVWLDRAVALRWSRNMLRKQLRKGGEPMAGRVTLRIVITPEQRHRWEAAASRVGRPLAEWMSDVLNKAAITP